MSTLRVLDEREDNLLSAARSLSQHGLQPVLTASYNPANPLAVERIRELVEALLLAGWGMRTHDDDRSSLIGLELHNNGAARLHLEVPRRILWTLERHDHKREMAGSTE